MITNQKDRASSRKNVNYFTKLLWDQQSQWLNQRMLLAVYLYVSLLVFQSGWGCETRFVSYTTWRTVTWRSFSQITSPFGPPVLLLYKAVTSIVCLSALDVCSWQLNLLQITDFLLYTLHSGANDRIGVDVASGPDRETERTFICLNDTIIKVETVIYNEEFF